MTATEATAAPIDQRVKDVGGARTARWLPDACGIAWLVVAAVAILTPALAHGTSLGPYDWLARYGLSKQPGVVIHDIHGDQILQMIPWTQLAWTQVHHAQLPLWNPYTALGMPLAFNWQSATFSLPALVGYLVPLRLAFTAQVLTTLIVAGSGAYVLGRLMRLSVLAATFAGTVFELSGAFVFWLGWPIGSVLSWAGWLFAAVLLITRGTRRVPSIVLFSVALAFAVYGGQPDALTLLILSVFLFAVAVLILRVPKLGGSGPILKPLFDLAVASVAGLALAAPLALPGYQVAAVAIRTFEGSTFGRQVAWTYQDLGHLAFQGLDGVATQLNPIYLGIIVVILALAGAWFKRRESPAIALIVVAVVMGAIAFVQPVENLLHLIPGLQAVRWYRSVVLMVLSVSVLAGLGMDLLVRSFRVRPVLRWLGSRISVGKRARCSYSGPWATTSSLGPRPGREASDSGGRWSSWPSALVGVGMLALVAKKSTPGDVRADTVARVVGAGFLVCATAFLVASGEPLWHSTSSYGTATPAEDLPPASGGYVARRAGIQEMLSRSRPGHPSERQRLARHPGAGCLRPDAAACLFRVLDSSERQEDRHRRLSIHLDILPRHLDSWLLLGSTGWGTSSSPTT